MKLKTEEVKMPKDGVMIVECISKSDPGSEGSFLKHLLEIMGVKCQLLQIRTKHQFVSLLQEPTFKFIHIATHGSVREKKKKDIFKGFWTLNGSINNTGMSLLKGRLAGHIVVSTACCSGADEFPEKFLKTTGCACFVAPKRSPSFHDAAFFSHIFYHKYFILERTDIPEVVEEYDDRYKNPHEFHAFTKNGD